MQYLTIRQTAKEFGLPEYAIRTMVKRKEAPGFFSGTRFYVAADLLRDQLEATSKANMTRTTAEAM